MPRGRAALAPLASAASLPSPSPSSLASAPSPSPPIHTWAVELQAGPGARQANDAALAAAIADSKVAPGSVALKIVHVLTRVPCGLGGELAVSKVDRRAIRQHELQIFTALVQPLVAVANGKKMPVKFVPVRNDSREAGLAQAAERMGAERLYISEPKNAWRAFDELSIHLPGGCTLILMQEGKRAREHQVQGVSFVDAPQAVTPGTRRLGRQASLGGSALLQIALPEEWERAPSDVPSPQGTPRSAATARNSGGSVESLGPRTSGAASSPLSLYVPSPHASPGTSSGATPAGPSGGAQAHGDPAWTPREARQLPGYTEPRISGRLSASPLPGRANAQRSGGHSGETPAARGADVAWESRTAGIPCSLSRNSLSGGTPSPRTPASCPEEDVAASRAQALPGGACPGAGPRSVGGWTKGTGLDSELLLFRQHVQMQQSLLQMHKYMNSEEQQQEHQQHQHQHQQQQQHERPRALPGLQQLPDRGIEVAETQWRQCWEELQALEQQVLEARIQARQKLMRAAVGGREPALPTAQKYVESVLEDHVIWASPAQRHAHELGSVTGPEAASSTLSGHMPSTTPAQEQWQVELSSQLRSTSLPGEESSRSRGRARGEVQLPGKGKSSSLKNTRTPRDAEPVSRPGGQLPSVSAPQKGNASETKSGGGALWSVTLLGKKIASFRS